MPGPAGPGERRARPAHVCSRRRGSHGRRARAPRGTHIHTYACSPPPHARPAPLTPSPRARQTRKLTDDSERDGIPADAVASVVLSALTARSPRARYLVGTAPGLHILRRLLPDSLLNPLMASYYSI